MSHFRFPEVSHRVALVLAYSLTSCCRLESPLGLLLLVSVFSFDPMRPGHVLAYGLGDVLNPPGRLENALGRGS